jgi:hypothetical protein
MRYKQREKKTEIKKEAKTLALGLLLTSGIRFQRKSFHTPGPGMIIQDLLHQILYNFQVII